MTTLRTCRIGFREQRCQSRDLLAARLCDRASIHLTILGKVMAGNGRTIQILCPQRLRAGPVLLLPLCQEKALRFYSVQT